ncbi:MAG: metallophosphoesterase, partial [Marinifilaceae bacterium]|nr:metallophosphoesterase [Marinifilaceae bacterium]
MKTGLFILFAGIVYILLNDSLLYLSIKRYLRTRLFRGIFWLHTLLFVAGFVVYHFLMPRLKGPETYYWIGEGISVFLLFYVPKTCYLLLQGIALLLKKFTGSTKVSRILQYTAVCVPVFFFGLILYGISWGRSDYKVEQVDVVIPDLPDSFNGLRVVQLTDLHLGICGKSFKGIAKLVERVNALNPDLIVFTGDMVNNFAEELEPWIEKLRGLHAPLGVYAVTGNHDYGK